MRVCALLLLFALHAAALAAGGGAATLEQQVKAAYLYKFAGYIEWPPAAFRQADSPVIIGVIGAPEIVDEIDKLRASHPDERRPVVVRSLRAGDALDGVQILFVDEREAGKLKRLLEGLQSTPVLLVTGAPGALASGSAINFVSVDNRIRFEVSVPHADDKGLKISARLLQVAQKIER